MTKTKKVKVGKYYFLIDLADLKLLKNLSWCAHSKPNGRVYAQAYVRLGKGIYRNIRMHRLILGLKIGDKSLGDHINHNTLDNRRCNLRICTPSQNVTNRRCFNKNKTSKYRGVSWRKRDKNWDVKVTKNGIHHRLGGFNNEDDAARNYNKKAKELHGNFAVLNEV